MPGKTHLFVPPVIKITNQLQLPSYKVFAHAVDNHVLHRSTKISTSCSIGLFAENLIFSIYLYYIPLSLSNHNHIAPPHDINNTFQGSAFDTVQRTLPLHLFHFLYADNSNFNYRFSTAQISAQPHESNKALLSSMLDSVYARLHPFI